MRKGFTLVELSIVLVVIGLLIGGIIAAQSMIRTVKVQSFIRQIGQYDAAVNNFQTLYKRLPGDNLYFGSAGVFEDNNILDATGGSAVNFTGEIARFWNDLAVVGLRNESGAPYAVGTGNIDVGSEVPASKLSKTAGIIAHGGSGSPGANVYTISNFVGTSISIGGTIPSDGLAIDTKMDDGVYSTGNVIVSDGTSSSFTIVVGSPDGVCRNSVGGALLLSTTSEACSMQIRIGTSTGDLK